jgi:hydrophobic/amphiphilic exporter-1 (mainly G- bacteria), HAE1 family
MTITELAIKRPSLIIVIFLAIGLVGTFGYFQLRYELLPKVEPPFVVVSTVYPGASPAEVETGVTKPIEDAVSSLEKISNIYANSYEGFSTVSIEYEYSANSDRAMQDVQRKINGILMTLPRDIRTPVVQKWTFEDVPIVQMGVSSSMPSRQFYQFLKDRVRPALSKLDGVGQVNLVGGEIREIRINLDAQKVRARGLSIAQITQIVRASNLDFPTGTIKGADRESVVRISGKFQSTDELQNLVIQHSTEGGEVRLRDVAEVVDGVQEYSSFNRINGQTTVGINILKQTDANAVEVSNKVREEIGRLESEYAAEGLRFDIVADGSLFTIEAADAVKKDLAVAVLLVSLVMFLFLHSVRNSIIVLVAIPASMISAALGMWILDYSLNLMTLLALSLVIGILVDDSIVVLENIHHHLEKGEDKRTAALRGRNEIGFAALSITLVDVVVFLPLTLIVGLVGDIMREFSVVVVISTLMSLVVSFTLTPLLASRFAKLDKGDSQSFVGRLGRRFESWFHQLTEDYAQLLGKSLNKPARVLWGATILLVVSLALPAVGLIGSEFIKQSDRGEFIVRFELEPGATLERSNRISQQLERMIAAMPEARKVQASVGVGQQGVQLSNTGRIYVLLSEQDHRRRSTDEIGNEIKERTRHIPGLKVYIQQIAITGEEYGAGIQVMVRGDNPDSLRAMTTRVREAMRRTATVTDVSLSVEQGKPELRIDVDREKMARFGLTVFDVGTTLRVALTGDDESKFSEGQTEYPIRVVLDKFDRSNPDDVGKLAFMTPTGRQVELQQFADIYPASGPSKLERFNRNASVTMTGYVDNTLPLGDVAGKFTEALGMGRVRGTSVTFAGDEKNRSESSGQMGFALLASIIFVYFIMVALYDSFVYPFVVLFSIPLALVGALMALALTRNALSIFSSLGIIMMVGLVAKNAILLIDRTNDNREQGLPVHDALLEAGRARLRPIFMTTLAMVFGMLPIALASGAGAEWKNGLAWALIGGLTSSMFLTLIVVPIVYTKVDRLRTRIPALFHRPFATGPFRKIRSLAEGGNVREESEVLP